MHPLQTSYMSPDGFLASSVAVLAEAPSFSRLRAAIFQRSMPQGDAVHATTLGSQQESICHVVFNTRWHEPRLPPEPKSDPGCPRRSVRAARLLLHDPDGSELNGKYGSAYQMTCNEGVHNSECVSTIVTKLLSSMERALSRFPWSTSTMSLSRHELKEFHRLLAEVLATATTKVLQNPGEE